MINIIMCILIIKQIKNRKSKAKGTNQVRIAASYLLEVA